MASCIVVPARLLTQPSCCTALALPHMLQEEYGVPAEVRRKQAWVLKGLEDLRAMLELEKTNPATASISVGAGATPRPVGWPACSAAISRGLSAELALTFCCHHLPPRPQTACPWPLQRLDGIAALLPLCGGASGAGSDR